MMFNSLSLSDLDVRVPRCVPKRAAWWVINGKYVTQCPLRGLQRGTQTGHRRVLPVLMLLLLAAITTGCQSYHLQGRVIEGPQSLILVVGKNDPRLAQPGVSGASLLVTVDPQSLNAQALPGNMTDMDGSFAIPVNSTGAGFLEYEIEVLCRATGFSPAAGTMPLPGGDKRLLIVLSPGVDRYRPRGDILGETIDMGRKLTPAD